MGQNFFLKNCGGGSELLILYVCSDVILFYFYFISALLVLILIHLVAFSSPSYPCRLPFFTFGAALFLFFYMHAESMGLAGFGLDI
jgi:hypothetical protein